MLAVLSWAPARAAYPMTSTVGLFVSIAASNVHVALETLILQAVPMMKGMLNFTRPFHDRQLRPTVQPRKIKVKMTAAGIDGR
jgi:hypothetical protein